MKLQELLKTRRQCRKEVIAIQCQVHSQEGDENEEKIIDKLSYLEPDLVVLNGSNHCE